MNKLTSKDRQALKARAHKLEPIVLIGNKGLTDAIIGEVDFALKAHELIKVRAPGLERGERAAAFATICERTGAEEVQQVGKVLILYRKRQTEEPQAN
jgi:RNA-binding protein